GFLVTGLSGNSRIHIFPPRLMKRVMATRLASICRSVIQPGSSTLSPKSPNDSSEPRQALPAMRPRCCLRYLTFFGINIKISSHLSECGCSYLRLAFLLRQNLAFVDPGLHADHSVRGPSFAESIFNIGAQRVQRQPALQIPFRARDFVSVQAARNSNLDAFASEAQCRIDTLAHSAAESDSFLELQRD